MTGVTFTVPSDMDRALKLYRTIAADGPDDRFIYLVIPGPPKSKSRARFSRKGFAYTPQADRDAEARTASFLRDVFTDGPFTGNVAMGCIFVRPNHQRIDADNMLKHIADAATGVAWIDDSQVTTLFARVEYDKDNPRTIAVFATDTSTMQRGVDASYPCAVCGSPIKRVGLTNLKKTCSKACAAVARGNRAIPDPVACLQCGKDFKRTTKTQRFCSPECGWASRRNVRRPGSRDLAHCIDCDLQLAHARHPSRCRECWRKYVASQRVERRA